MKKIYTITVMLLLSLAGKAQIGDMLQISLNELQFHTVDSFTQVSLDHQQNPVFRHRV
jgi:hypothetical protein